MIHDFKCPNCGNTNAEAISEGTYKCQYCSTVFKDESLLNNNLNKEKIKLISEHISKVSEINKRNSKMAKQILLYTFIFVIIVFAFVAYMSHKNQNPMKNNPSNEKFQENIQEEIQKKIREELNKQ